MGAYRLVAKLLGQRAVSRRELIELDNTLVGEFDGIGVLGLDGLLDRGVFGGGRHSCNWGEVGEITAT